MIGFLSSLAAVYPFWYHSSNESVSEVIVIDPESSQSTGYHDVIA